MANKGRHGAASLFAVKGSSFRKRIYLSYKNKILQAQLLAAFSAFNSLINPTDNISAIIRGCSQNNRQAQALLYKKFYGALGSICMRYTRDEQDAIEVLNDGFLKIFKSIHQYEESKSALYTWMSRIVTNCCIDFLRKKQAVHFSPVEEHTEEIYYNDSVVQTLDAQELLSLIRQLPPTTQLVFNLHVIEGYPHKEIAERLAIKEGTSKWHVNEARKLLQKKIQHLAAAS